MLRPYLVSTPMIAVMISGGTPNSASARRSTSALRCQNSTPSSIRSGVSMIARYSYQGLASAGRVIAAMMLSWNSAPSSTAVSSAWS